MLNNSICTYKVIDFIMLYINKITSLFADYEFFFIFEDLEKNQWSRKILFIGNTERERSREIIG